jgi:4-hydroxysphinganine ceramide fatty acyl 2-hydroxylase
MKKAGLQKLSRAVFKNRFLERLSRTHVMVPVSLFLLFAAVFTVYAFKEIGFGITEFLLLFAGGLFTFTLAEYCIHRFIYHIDHDTYNPDSWKYLMHGIHHDYPRDEERLAMPPILGITVAAIFFMLFKSIMIYQVYAFYPGFITGYALYLLVHYAVHALRPPRNFLRYLWKHHSLHHYKYPDKAFGVTSALWDIVFNTMPPRERNVSSTELQQASTKKAP